MSKLTSARFKQAEFMRTVWSAVIEAGTAFEEILKRDFWAHIAGKMKQFDRIEALSEDGKYFAELMVVSCDRLWANVVVLRHKDLEGGGQTQISPDEYEIKYQGPIKKHAVIRLSDNAIMKDEIQTKADANHWLSDHLKAGAK